VPAAAVIPAPIAYIKVAAVKTLAVGLWAQSAGLLAHVPLSGPSCLSAQVALNWVAWVPDTFTLRKLGCSRQVLACTY
jgi:hypothetical protein